jgi:hypothetical protein
MEGLVLMIKTYFDSLEKIIPEERFGNLQDVKVIELIYFHNQFLLKNPPQDKPDMFTKFIPEEVLV